MALWSFCAGVRSPSRRRLRRRRRAAGGRSSRICRSGEVRCSGRRRRGEDGGWRTELLSPGPLFVAARSAPSCLRRVWGWCGVVRAALVGSSPVRFGWRPGLLFSGVDGLLDGAMSEDGGGPGGCRWRVGEGSVGLLRGWPDMEQTELGARRRPIWLHRLHPSRWRWCFLRLSKLSGKGLCLIQGSAMVVFLRHLHLEWKWEDSWLGLEFEPSRAGSARLVHARSTSELGSTRLV